MHRRPRLSSTLGRTRFCTATLVIAGVTGFAGCSSSVEVGVPERADGPACAVVSWPETVAGQARVSTDPSVPWAAAWGDPAIIARCGLPALEPTTFDCVVVDGVDWIVRELGDGTAMSSYGTDPAVEVLVPARYGPGPLLLPAFGDVARTLPRNSQACS